MRNLQFVIFLAATILFTTTITQTNVKAEEVKDLLQKVEDYDSEGNYTKALEELAWVKKELEKKYMSKLSQFLPETLLKYSGQKIKNSAAMGMSQVSRKYKKGSNTFTIEIISGTSGSVASGFGGLAALGQMAALMGQNSGQSTVRIKGRTASHDEENNEMVIFLEGGKTLRIEQNRGSVDLKSIAEELDYDGIESFFKGTK